MTKIKPGQKFHRLTTISYTKGNRKTIKCKATKGRWLCQCECGETLSVITAHLISGNTKSCGCLRIEKSQNNIKQAIKASTQYEPWEASAHRRWLTNGYSDPWFNLSFEEWKDLSQKPCHYCGVVCFNNFNCFTDKKDASQYSKDNGNYPHNGMDRIDSSLPHIVGNVVPCCIICNRGKLKRTAEEFYQHINQLRINNDFSISPPLLILPTSYMLVSVKIAYRYYLKNYGKMEIDLQTFYTYSQLECFYCGEAKSNCCNVYLKDKKASQAAKDGAYFRYNGLDRIDNSLGHTIKNIVSCCIWCNFAKSNLSTTIFQDWIRRIQEYQLNKR